MLIFFIFTSTSYMKYYIYTFFEGKTQTEVAERINISQAQVSRLEKNALKNMRA